MTNVMFEGTSGVVRRTGKAIGAVVVGALLTWAVSTLGQELPAPASPATQPATQPAAQPAELAQPPQLQPPAADDAAADDAEADDDTVREQTIYIPFDKLQSVFEKQGRGVFLPYEQFQQLWRRARAAERPRVETGPPAGALISEISSVAVVETDVVVVTARLRIELLRKGWHKIPLRLSDAAIRSARIGDQSAQVTFDAHNGYELLIRHDADESAQVELQLEYAKAFAKSPRQNSVSFEAPQASINRWRIRVPQAGVKVNIHPLIAATEVPAGDPDNDAMPPDDGAAAEDGAAADGAAADETVLLAFVGAAPTVRIDWTPKAEGASGLAALATVLARQELIVEEGVVRTRVHLAYTISRAELPRLVVEVPADQKVTGLFDPNIRSWEVAADDAVQRITIELFQPARGLQNVSVELERFADDEAMRQLAVPVIRAIDVGRQQGFVVVRLAEGAELRMETAERRGLVQVDQNELPGELRNQPWPLAFRYATVPFELRLQVEKLVPRVHADQLVEAVLTPRELTLHQLLLLDIQRAGLFQIELKIPPGFDVEVLGRAAAGAEAAVVDTYPLEGEDKTRLVVNLSRKALGRIGLVVRLRRVLTDSNLLAPTGESSEIALPLPQLTTAAEQFRGRLVVYAPESLQVNPQQVAGARAVSLGEALDGVESVSDGRLADARGVLAFAYARDPVTLSLDVQRRRPQTTVRQFLNVRVEEGIVKYDARFFYAILYSGVPSLRIDIPAELTDLLNTTPPSIRGTVLAPQPDDVPDGYISWSFAGSSAELIGDVNFRLTWERKLDDLAVGAGIDVPVPVLRPSGVDRAWGQIAVAKAETLDVRTASGVEGLRPIDPQHDLMPGAGASDAARAFQFQDDWSLALTVTRYELEDVKRTSIERAVLRMVVTRSDRTPVQALYQLRSALQRLAIQLPKGAELDNDPLRINGQPKGLEQGDDGLNFIPLADQVADTPLLVELRYTVKGNQRELTFPVFPAQPPLQSAPAMQKVHLCVYLPDELRVLEANGPWTNEQNQWPPRVFESIQRSNDDDLLDWVSSGVDVDRARLKSFPVDGRLFRFTGLRPPPPPEGALRLQAVHERLLHGLVFGSLAVVALLFWRQPAAQKVIALTAVVVVLVLVGVFFPTIAMQILNEYLVVACGLVILVWGVAELVRHLRSSRQPPPPPPDAPAPDDELRMVGMERGDSPFRSPPRNESEDVDSGQADDAPTDDEPPAQGGEHHA